MMTEEFKEVSDQDYKELENIFTNLLEDTQVDVLMSPVLQEKLDDFIVKVGIATKELLQKYGKQDYIQKLEVADCQKKLTDMNRKMVKMNLQTKQIENAVQAFKNVSKS